MRYFVESKEGEITTVFQFSVEGEIPAEFVEIETDESPKTLHEEYAIIDRQLVHIGERPSDVPVTLDVEERKWVPNIEGLKSSLQSQINVERDKHRYSGVTYNGVRFDSDTVSAGNLTECTVGVSAGIPLPDGFTWRSEDNQDIPFTDKDVIGLATAMMLKTNACYQRSWQLKAIVNSFEGQESYQALKDLDITSGWPE